MSDNSIKNTKMTQAKKKKNAPWVKPYHIVVRNVAEIVLYPFIRLLYGARVKRFDMTGKRQYLILMNHQTAFDQFFVGLAFKNPIYYITSEDLFSKGFISDLIRVLVNPIPIKKQTTDPRAVINCIKVAREGGTIAMAPEGNRTYDGRPLYINPTVAPLARKLGLPIALFRIEGGYGVHPRWSDVVRGGGIDCYVSRVLEPEEYADMTDEELYKIICEELAVNEARVTGVYPHKKNAEYLERAIYTCPVCGFSKLESHGDTIRCTSCGLEVKHTDTKELVSENDSFDFRFVADWYDYQVSLVTKLTLDDYKDTPMFTDSADLYEVIPYKNKRLIKKAVSLELYIDRVIIDGAEYPYDSLIGVTVLGKNKMNIYQGDKLYQIKGDKRFCALKYVNIFNHYKNLTKKNTAHAVNTQEEDNGNGREFLGL